MTPEARHIKFTNGCYRKNKVDIDVYIFAPFTSIVSTLTLNRFLLFKKYAWAKINSLS